jgi:general nucleoside transport system ATP-binding protein
MKHALASVSEVTKRFGSLVAVDRLSLEVEPGEVHALIGGNGAGKTTAMKMLAGLLKPDGGQVLVGGVPVEFQSRRDAIRRGIGFIQQEFSLVDTLTCAENLLLGHPEHGFVLDRRGAADAIRSLNDRFGASIEPERLVGTLSMGERQQLEILVALSWGGRIVILDEPTSATGESGLEFLRRAVAVLREEDVGVVYITHKLAEVVELADRVTVMRRARKVWEGAAAGVDTQKLAAEMVGDTALLARRRVRREPGAIVLQLDDVSLRGSGDLHSLHDVSLVVRQREILGIAGVVGNGQRELARVAAGLIVPSRGTVLRPSSVGYVAEDRSRDSLAPELAPTENAVVHAHRRPPIVRWGFLRRSAIRTFTRRLLDRFAVDPTVLDRTSETRQLSGGNQQRLVLGRELDESSQLLVLHNPARGLDVAAAADLFRQLDEFCAAGGGALLISPDLEELVEWSNAIHVLFAGRLGERLPAERETIPLLAQQMAGV